MHLLQINYLGKRGFNPNTFYSGGIYAEDVYVIAAGEPYFLLEKWFFFHHYYSCEHIYITDSLIL